MKQDKYITEAGLTTLLSNYKNAFIITFETNDNKKRTYRREHKKRLSTKQFNTLLTELLSYDFIKDRFSFLKNKGFEVTE